MSPCVVCFGSKSALKCVWATRLTFFSGGSSSSTAASAPQAVIQSTFLSRVTYSHFLLSPTHTHTLTHKYEGKESVLRVDE